MGDLALVSCVGSMLLHALLDAVKNRRRDAGYFSNYGAEAAQASMRSAHSDWLDRMARLKNNFELRMICDRVPRGRRTIARVYEIAHVYLAQVQHAAARCDEVSLRSGSLTKFLMSCSWLVFYLHPREHSHDQIRQCLYGAI